jgi:hypothetical protein
VTQSESNVTCTLAPLAVGESAQIAIVAKANLGTTRDDTINWEGELVPQPGDVNDTNDGSLSATTTIPKPSPLEGPFGPSKNTLIAGLSLASPNGQYALTMLDDGNLEEIGNGRVLWQSNTSGNLGGYFRYNSYTGSATVFDGNDQPIWAADVKRKSVLYGSFDVTNDGTLVDYDPDGILWDERPAGSNGMTAPATLSSGQYIHAGKAMLLLKPNGALVDYVGTKVVWSAHTSSHPGDTLHLRSDGELVVYSRTGKAIWSSRSGKTGKGHRLTLSPNGRLVLTHDGKTVWRVG